MERDGKREKSRVSGLMVFCVRTAIRFSLALSADDGKKKCRLSASVGVFLHFSWSFSHLPERTRCRFGEIAGGIVLGNCNGDGDG